MLPKGVGLVAVAATSNPDEAGAGAVPQFEDVENGLLMPVSQKLCCCVGAAWVARCGADGRKLAAPILAEADAAAPVPGLPSYNADTTPGGRSFLSLSNPASITFRKRVADGTPTSLSSNRFMISFDILSNAGFIFVGNLFANM